MKVYDDSQDRPTGNRIEPGWIPAKFIGEKVLDSGTRMAIFKLFNEKDGDLIPTKVEINVWITPIGKPEVYKMSILKELFKAWNLSKKLEEGTELTLPTYGKAIPDSVSTMVRIFVRVDPKSDQGYLQSWSENYQTIRPYTPEGVNTGGSTDDEWND